MSPKFLTIFPVIWKAAAGGGQVGVLPRLERSAIVIMARSGASSGPGKPQLPETGSQSSNLHRGLWVARKNSGSPYQINYAEKLEGTL
jgi:hypothetical protein